MMIARFFFFAVPTLAFSCTRPNAAAAAAAASASASAAASSGVAFVATTTSLRRNSTNGPCRRVFRLNALSKDDAAETTSIAVSRRQLGMRLLRQSGVAAVIALSPPGFANAASTSDSDKNNILKGYQRLTYLLENWERLTQVCDNSKVDPFTGKTTCVKSPLVVSEYLGFKSMKDPLFKADKTMRRLETFVPPAKEAEYFDLVERWLTTSEEAQGMAYTSSWAGPENPNGGDDSIDEYLERSKKQVIDARGTLKTVIDILNLSP